MKDMITLKHTIQRFLLESKEDCIVVNKKENLTLSIGITNYLDKETLFMLVSESESDIDYHYFENHSLDLNEEFLNIVYDKYTYFFDKYNFK